MLRQTRVILLPLIAMLSLPLASTPAGAELHFEFDGRFSQAQREKLITWATEVKEGVEGLVGQYPFDIRVRFTRSWSWEPVPFGRTYRGRMQGIQFHVNPRFSLEELLEDWTAAHEFSHLILPFLGSQNAWFAEGFASFMQYQVMHAMGVIGPDEVARRYRQKLDKSARRYRYPDRAFVATTPKLQAERKYPVMYWGGAVFFFRANETLLANADMTIIEFLAEYMQCCRRSRSSLQELVRVFDGLVDAPYLSGELAAFEKEKGFPGINGIDMGVVAP